MIITCTFHQFPGGSDSKESTCNAGDLGSIPGWKDSLENGIATLSSLLSWRIPWTKEPDSLWGHKESNMTEKLTISFPFQTLFTVYGYQLLPKPTVVVAAVSELNVAQSCPTLCNPMDCNRQAPLSMEFSRQEYWSGLPFPSPSYWYISPNTLFPFTSRHMIELYFPDPVKLVVTT